MLCVDLTGNKEMLQNRLEKLCNIKETLPLHEEKLKEIEALVNDAATCLPAHYRESMVKDFANVK